jgi:hypothetical protein
MKNLIAPSTAFILAGLVNLLLAFPSFADFGNLNVDLYDNNSKLILLKARTELSNTDLPKLGSSFWNGIRVNPEVLYKALIGMEEHPEQDPHILDSSGFSEPQRFGYDSSKGIIFTYRQFFIEYMQVSADQENLYLRGLKTDLIHEALHLVYGSNTEDKANSVAKKIVDEIYALNPSEDYTTFAPGEDLKSCFARCEQAYPIHQGGIFFNGSDNPQLDSCERKCGNGLDTSPIPQMPPAPSAEGCAQIKAICERKSWSTEYLLTVTSSSGHSAKLTYSSELKDDCEADAARLAKTENRASGYMGSLAIPVGSCYRGELLSVWMSWIDIQCDGTLVKDSWWHTGSLWTAGKDYSKGESMGDCQSRLRNDEIIYRSHPLVDNFQAGGS